MGKVMKNFKGDNHSGGLVVISKIVYNAHAFETNLLVSFFSVLESTQE